MKIPPLFSFEARKKYLREQFEKLGRDGLKVRLLEMADHIGHDRFRRQAAGDLMTAIRPAEVLPDVYADFRPMVSDGIRFMIERLSVPRIAGLTAAQAALAPDGPDGERLLALALEMPTLHKLGQIIARNRHLHPAFKAWLIRLENGPATTSAEQIREMIRLRLGDDMARFAIQTEDDVLAEASVGVTIPFTFVPAPAADRRRGVFKLLKPGVTDRLTEELALLAELAAYFEARREHYPLREFRFAEIFKDIREALLEEINLAGEQANLKRARRFYHGRGSGRVPEVHPFSTEDLTAMSFMPGEKVTDAALPSSGRKRLAQNLFTTLVWSPLFSRQASPPFHGDPHAGNLFAGTSRFMGRFPVGLIDWSLSGTLPRGRRRRLICLMLGIATGDVNAVQASVQSLSVDENKGDSGFSEKLRTAIHDITRRPEYNASGIARRAFTLVDGLAMEGFRFPADLMLFRKTFFTLEGVIADLDPDFDMDGTMRTEMTRLLVAEMPQRWTVGMFPALDRPEAFRSLLSNRDIRFLAWRLLMELVGRQTVAMVRQTLPMFLPLACLPVPQVRFFKPEPSTG